MQERVFAAFKDCEDARQREVTAALISLGQLRATPERSRDDRATERAVERAVYARCVPLR